EPGRVLDERTELGKPSLRRRRVARQVVVAATCSDELTPGVAEPVAPAQVVGPDEAVEDGELGRGAREGPRLELSGHGHEALRSAGDVLPGGRASPGVRARAPVGEDAPGDDEPVLVLRANLAEGFEPLLVEELGRYRELGLDVRVRAGEADVARVALR